MTTVIGFTARTDTTDSSYRTVPFTADELADAYGGAIPMPERHADPAPQNTGTADTIPVIDTDGAADPDTGGSPYDWDDAQDDGTAMADDTPHIVIPAPNQEVPDTQAYTDETPERGEARRIPIERQPVIPPADDRIDIPDPILIGVRGGLGWRAHLINIAAWTLIVAGFAIAVPIVLLTVTFLLKLAVSVIVGLTTYLFNLIGGLI